MHWLAYGYEVIGGILIFISSAVTETQLPAPERRKHWIVFGIVAVMYIGFGLGLRYMESVDEPSLGRHNYRTFRKPSCDKNNRSII